jgi:uncharacterized low-complexity protein
MAKQAIRQPLSLVIGAALVSGLGATGVASAAQTDANIFAMQDLSSGYLVAGAHEQEKDGEGKCGDGKCGEGKCGDDKDGDDKDGEDS